MLSDKQVEAGLILARFPSLNKQDDIRDYESQLPETAYEPVKVAEVVHLPTGEYDEFVHNFLTDREWLAGKGGTYSLADLPEVESFTDFTEDQRKAFIAEAYLVVIEVRAQDRRTIYIDPQGYNYARYVGF